MSQISEYNVNSNEECKKQRVVLSSDEEDDGRIMAYLEKDGGEHKIEGMKAIDFALDRFMGGFTELKDEIA